MNVRSIKPAPPMRTTASAIWLTTNELRSVVRLFPALVREASESTSRGERFNTCNALRPPMSIPLLRARAVAKSTALKSILVFAIRGTPAGASCSINLTPAIAKGTPSAHPKQHSRIP
jgi:hypothetical protein